MKFQWFDNCEESLEKLKSYLVIALMLALPTSFSGFTVDCDISKIGLRFMLMQHGKIIVYTSR